MVCFMKINLLVCILFFTLKNSMHVVSLCVCVRVCLKYYNMIINIIKDCLHEGS